MESIFRREPTLRFFYRAADGKFVTRHIDPASGALVPEQGTWAGTGFIFPFHYRLHIRWLDLGYWLVGLASMAMLALLVSGVVIHRKLFAELFTFRPQKRLPRASLDLHDLTGVFALPFHFVITLSGLVIFIGIYFPQAQVAVYGPGEQAQDRYRQEAYGIYKRDKAGRPGTLASLDAMVGEAERHRPGGRAFFVRVWHPGDANGWVEVRRSYARDVTMHLDRVIFDAQTGALLERVEAKPVMTVQRVIVGLHFIQFDHWTLRWLYFLAGLSVCVMIATGFVAWLEARRARHEEKDLAGVRMVEGLTIGSVTGIIIATLAFFAINRLLPLGTSFAGQGRAALEMWAFYLVWVLPFIHAWLRPACAWRAQAWVICLLALACALLNAITTGDHLIRAFSSGMWSVAGMDALLLALAMLSACMATRLRRKAVQSSRAQAGAATLSAGRGS